MAKDQAVPPQPDADPQAGGSYVRNPDGTLTKTDGTAESVAADKTEKE